MSRSLDRLSSLDRLMLGASKRWPQDIGALAMLDGTTLLDPAGELRIDAVREAIAARLPLVPRFRQVIHVPGRGLGGPLWVDAVRFDIRDHVVARTLPPGTGQTGLLAVIEELRSQRFDPSRPLWRMWVMPGLPDGRVALFVKLHHAIADGMAAMTTIAAFLDADPQAPITPASPWTPAPAPPDRDLFIDNAQRHLQAAARAGSMLVRPAATLRQARQAWPAIRELLAEKPATRTSLDRMVGPGRSLAVIRSSLEEVKTVAHAHGATVNDVLLALTAGGLRAVLRGRGEPVTGITVRAYVPVSLRPRADGPQQGNLIAQMAVPLAMREPDAGDELRRIAAKTTARKARARTSLGTLIRGRLMRRLVLFAVMRQRVNVTTASIPGPAVPLYLTGARVLEVFPVLPLIANEPLGVGALSYAGGFNIGVAADRDAYPDLGVFVAGAREELETLGISTHPIPALQE
ncbi:MAG TPA: wax ester/triacylglycerol synthase family O-acyltransferase [Streptosporangiaceae bacterium]